MKHLTDFLVDISNPKASTSDLGKAHPYLGARLQYHLLVLTDFDTSSQSLIQTLGHLEVQNAAFSTSCVNYRTSTFKFSAGCLSLLCMIPENN